MAYRPAAALLYVSRWWDSANHNCSTPFDACSPFSYWGGEACGFPSKGGDCANFVSQALLAGGHPPLVKAPCRGYPCGVEEVGATKLGACLALNYGWSSTCLPEAAGPPASVVVGDVIVWHNDASCADEDAHATFVTSVDLARGWVGISAHSTDVFNVSHAPYFTEFAYADWLHFEGASASTSSSSSAAASPAGGMVSAPPTLAGLRAGVTGAALVAALAASPHGGAAALAASGRGGARGAAPPPADTTPQQVHAAPGPGAPGTSLRLVWTTTALIDPAAGGVGARWWPADAAPNASSSFAPATASTYSAGESGWRGWIYTSVMSGLTPGGRYAYTVGGGAGGGTTDVRGISAPPAPAPDARLRVAMAADMGTIVPLGWAVADRLAEEHLEGATRYDGIVLAGDLAYATVEPASCGPTNPGCDEAELVWDFFGLQIEPFAATAPLLTSTGNHERPGGNFTPSPGTPPQPLDFAAYTARYRMPFDGPGGGSAHWWSTELGPLHYASISSEHAFAPGSPQYAWLESDLARCSRATTPWLVVALHRPVLSAAALEWADHSPGAPLSAALEPLFVRYGVDVVFAGHIHSYETTFPVINGTVMGAPAPNSSTFLDPAAPVYVVGGTSGALPENVFLDPPPAWSWRRVLGSFGYGRLQLGTDGDVRFLTYDFVGMLGETLDSWGINKTVV